MNEPSRNMANVVITTKGFRTRLIETNYMKGKEKRFDQQEVGKKELMRVTNTSEWTGIKYRMPPELVAAITVRTNRRSSRRGVAASRNGGDLKFDIEGFK